MAAVLYGFVPLYLRILLLMTLSGSALVLLMLLLRVLWENTISKSAHYRLWKIALLGFLVPFSLFLSLPVSTPVTGMQNAIERTTAGIQVQDAAPAEPAPEQSGPVLEGGNGSAPAASSAAHTLHWGAVLAAVPMAVSGVLLVYTAGSYLRFVRKLRRSRRDVSGEELRLFQKLAPAKRQPGLCRSAVVPTPMLVGILEPTIYLPDRAYTDGQLENILRHELTHFRRGDVVFKWIGVLLTCLHWFNPLAWCTRRQLDRFCELSCDERVIASFDDTQKQTYGDTLIEMAAQTRLPRQIISAGISEEKKNLKDRLTAIMESKPITKGKLVFAAVLTVLALCTVTVLGATQTEGDIDPDTIVSCRSMSFGEEDSALRDGILPFYDDFADLKTEKIRSDTYTKALVELVNSYSKTPLSPLEEGARVPVNLGGHWTRLDCADGGYWMLNWAHGFICYSFNPLHFGEDEYETLLTYVDPAGNPVQTWVMDYDFDWPYLHLQEDGTLPPQKQFSLSDIKVRAVVSLNRYCTAEEVNAWMPEIFTSFSPYYSAWF